MIYRVATGCRLFVTIKILVVQAPNQEFFRAGEVSENKGTSINI